MYYAHDLKVVCANKNFAFSLLSRYYTGPEVYIARQVMSSSTRIQEEQDLGYIDLYDILVPTIIQNYCDRTFPI